MSDETTTQAAPAEARHDLLRLLEAMLFASAEPLPQDALAARLPEGAPCAELLGELQAQYAARGVNLVQREDRWAFRTAPDLAQRLRIEQKVTRRLSRAAVETLAVVAYHQPVTRHEIEEIRGVALSRGTLDILLEAGWIRPKGRRQAPGRPVTWVTTDAFLDHFGLEGRDALPGLEELKAAGLLDARPAVTTLAMPGGGAPEEDGDGTADEGGEEAQDDDALLPADFGEDDAGQEPEAPEAQRP